MPKFKSYAEYLKSDAWARAKRRYRKSAKQQFCYICRKKSKPVDIHHKTYKRIGHEHLKDLIPLCRECHYAVHERVELLGGSKTSNYRAIKQLKKEYRQKKRRKQ